MLALELAALVTCSLHGLFLKPGFKSLINCKMMFQSCRMVLPLSAL